MNKVNLFADVLNTTGYLRSSLLDSTRFKVHFIDNETSKLFQTSENKKVDKNQIENSFYELLNDNELIFDSENFTIDQFPNLTFEWDSPYLITNFVFDFSDENVQFLTKNKNLFIAGHIHVVFRNFFSENSFNQLIDFLETQFCDCIEITLTNNNVFFQKDNFEKKLIKLNKIVRILNYTNEDLDSIYEKPHKYKNSLEFIDLKISKFSDHFFESKLHHTYFNRKLYISSKGEIKNAPECEESFGNISDLDIERDLLKIIDKPDFQKYWFIKKDDTEICRDCELRYMCVDNRLPIERNKSEWFHKKECQYNPYISKWKGEEGYKSLSECGVISNENGFSIDHKKIEQINAILWSEEEVETE